MSDLAILVPSRNRPHNIIELKKSFVETCTGNTDLIVLVDDDDKDIEEYKKIEGINLIIGPRLRIGGTLNKFAPEIASRYKNIGFLGDDHRPRTHGWDTTFINELNRIKVGIVFGNDLYHKGNLATSVTMTSNIVTTLGYMCVPGSIHLFIDNFWMAIGHGTNITYFDEVVIEHMHPVYGKAAGDEVYAQANSKEVWDADNKTYDIYIENSLASDLEKLKVLI